MPFIDVWLGRLPLEPAILQQFTRLLDHQEQETAGTYKNLLMQQKYIAVRGLLRLTLARYLAVEPVFLQFVRGEYGKPGLIGYRLSFNLSHTADSLAIAVSDLETVGVDIESIQPRKGLHDIARRSFSAQEFGAWRTMTQAQQIHAFYKVWTQKEAFVKAVGRGIALGLERCEVDLSAGGFVNIPAEYGLAKNWRVLELQSEAEICGAVVAPNVEFVFAQYSLDRPLANKPPFKM